MLATTRMPSPIATRRLPDRAVPVEPNERLHALDVLRGLALIFMILVHFHQFMRLESKDWQGLISWGIWGSKRRHGARSRCCSAPASRC